MNTKHENMLFMKHKTKAVSEMSSILAREKRKKKSIKSSIGKTSNNIQEGGVHKSTNILLRIFHPKT